MIGISSIIGWLLHIPTLYTYFSHGASMKFNTALAMVLLSLSIGSAILNRRILAGFLGLVIIVFCIFTLLQYVLGINLHIDEWLIHDHLTNAASESPGRMSLYTTVTFFIITFGLGLSLLKKYAASQIFGAIGLIGAYISFLGILFNISGLFSFGSYSAISLPTALGAISASIALLLFTSNKGWLREMASNHSAAVTTRYSLLYFLLSLPFFIGLFLLMLSKAQLPAEIAIVLLIVGFAALTLPFAFTLLKKLNRSDEKIWKLMKDLEDRSQELTENNYKLAIKNNELDSLIHIISHDLKTPITSLQASLEIMERKLGANMQVQDLQLLTISKRSVNNLKETINNLGEIIRSKQLENARMENIDLCTLVSDIISEHESVILDTNADVSIAIENCYVYYERIHLHSIIQNLVTNALKYRHPDRNLVISISSEKVNDGVKLMVTDNGLGIPEKQRHNLFNKYTRFHEHVEGTGVGLYLVRQLLGRNGGSIDVVSEENVGTTFTIFIPIQ